MTEISTLINNLLLTDIRNVYSVVSTGVRLSTGGKNETTIIPSQAVQIHRVSMIIMHKMIKL